MFLDISDFGVLTNVKTVDAVVLRVDTATVVDATAGDDDNLGVFADVEVVVNCFFKAGGADGDRNVNGFVFGAGFNVNI